MWSLVTGNPIKNDNPTSPSACGPGHSQALTPRSPQSVLGQMSTVPAQGMAPAQRGPPSPSFARGKDRWPLPRTVDYREPASSPQGGQGQLGTSGWDSSKPREGTATGEFLTQPLHVTPGQRLHAAPSPPSLGYTILRHLCTLRTQRVNSHGLSSPHFPVHTLPDLRA